MEPPWHHFGDHVDLLGRSVALLWLCLHVFGHYFDSLDVQTKKIATILASHVRLLLLILHISMALVLAPLKSPLLCIGQLYLSCVSHLHLSISPLTVSLHLAPHILSFALVICTSDC